MEPVVFPVIPTGMEGKEPVKRADAVGKDDGKGSHTGRGYKMPDAGCKMQVKP
jgi:hypothetical protein